MTSKKNSIRILVGFFGLILLIGLGLLTWKSKFIEGYDGQSYSHPSEHSNSMAFHSVDAAANKIVEQSESNNTKRHSLGLDGRYTSYLDELCPLLTDAEENRLVAESGGNPRVMVGLVFSGSARWQWWLQEALKKAPEDPLVHYTILSRDVPGFDRLHSALELARLAPQDALPLHIAALEALKLGDRATALSYLQQADTREKSSSFYQLALQSAIDALRLAGRPENDARARMVLQGMGQWEVIAARDLGEGFGLMGPDGKTLWGDDNLASLIIAANQKTLYTPGYDFGTYTSGRFQEIEYLKAIIAAQNPKLDEYLPAPASEMLANAKTELMKLDGIAFFSNDKPGIYMRLAESEKSELIQRISRDGEISAYLWAYNTRPDIFQSPDFSPQSVYPGTWAVMLQQPRPFTLLKLGP